MIRTVTCLVVECDGCGTTTYDGDDDDSPGTPHFGTHGGPESGWVRRCGPPATGRCRCTLPLLTGARGDLWRCPYCRTLWRLGDSCDWCDRYGVATHVRGQCAVGTKWRPATLGQRIRYWSPR